MLQTFSLIFILEFCHLATAVSSEYGHITPTKEIKLKHGEDLHLNCTLFRDNERNASSSLIFRAVTENHIADLTLNTTVQNSTSISLHIKNPKPVLKARYDCLFQNGTHVDYNFVTIGEKPKDIDDFECNFFDLTELQCKWTDKNYLQTDYTVNYSSSKNIGWYDSINCTSGCTTNDKTYSCTWNSMDLVHHCYNDLSRYHRFTVVIRDDRGQLNNFEKVYDQWENVMPLEPVIKINPNQSKPDSMELQISLKEPTKYKTLLKTHIKFAVNLTVTTVNWKNVPYEKNITILLEATTLKYNITNLPFANAKYAIKAVLFNMKNNNNRFLKYSETEGSTKSKRPDCPPKTTVGAFEDDTNNIKIYWEEIEEHEKNGDDFGYYIEEKNNQSLNKYSNSCFAALGNVKRTRDMTFRVWSKNTEGLSKNYSEIFVPANKYGSIDKLSLLDDVNYTFYWEPLQDNPIKNYTVFWCKVKISGRKNLVPNCQENFNWAILTKYETNFTLPKTYSRDNLQFGLATNYDQGSSGITWTSHDCIFPPFKTNQKLNISINPHKEKEPVINWQPDLDKCAGIKSIKSKSSELIYCFQGDKTCTKINTKNTQYVMKGLNRDLPFNVTIFMNFTLFGHPMEAYGTKTENIILAKLPFVWYFLLLIIPAVLVIGFIAHQLIRKIQKHVPANPVFRDELRVFIDSRKENNENLLQPKALTQRHENETFKKDNVTWQKAPNYVVIGQHKHINEIDSLLKSNFDDKTELPNDKKPVLNGYVPANHKIEAYLTEPSIDCKQEHILSGTSDNNRAQETQLYVTIGSDGVIKHTETPHYENSLNDQKPITSGYVPCDITMTAPPASDFELHSNGEQKLVLNGYVPPYPEIETYSTEPSLNCEQQLTFFDKSINSAQQIPHYVIVGSDRKNNENKTPHHQKSLNDQKSIGYVPFDSANSAPSFNLHSTFSDNVDESNKSINISSLNNKAETSHDQKALNDQQQFFSDTKDNANVQSSQPYVRVGFDAMNMSSLDDKNLISHDRNTLNNPKPVINKYVPFIRDISGPAALDIELQPIVTDSVCNITQKSQPYVTLGTNKSTEKVKEIKSDPDVKKSFEYLPNEQFETIKNQDETNKYVPFDSIYNSNQNELSSPCSGERVDFNSRIKSNEQSHTTRSLDNFLESDNKESENQRRTISNKSDIGPTPPYVQFGHHVEVE